MKNYSYLLVEDNPIDSEKFERAFKKLNLTRSLTIAPDGVEALTALPNLVKPFVVVLDLNMPRMNGLEFLHALRKDPNYHATPVLIMTSSDEEKDIVEAYDYNVAGYMLKPVGIQELMGHISAVEAFLEKCVLPP